MHSTAIDEYLRELFDFKLGWEPDWGSTVAKGLAENFGITTAFDLWTATLSLVSP